MGTRDWVFESKAGTVVVRRDVLLFLGVGLGGLDGLVGIYGGDVVEKCELERVGWRREYGGIVEAG